MMGITALGYKYLAVLVIVVMMGPVQSPTYETSSKIVDLVTCNKEKQEFLAAVEKHGDDLGLVKASVACIPWKVPTAWTNEVGQNP